MAKILYGAPVKEAIREKIAKQKAMFNKPPKLVIIHVGSDPASEVYVGSKVKECICNGINCEVKNYPENADSVKIIADIRKLNSNDEVSGIMVQLPLPKNINEHEIISEINPDKDVDGITPYNAGLLLNCPKDFGLAPCTPAGIMELLSDVDIEGKHAVIVGRSAIVGKPLASMLLKANATVTVCHSCTKYLSDYTKMADILVVAIGSPKFITADMVKEGAIVIDVGINRTENGLVGDVDFENVEPLVSAITPVPKGVGVTTVAMLMNNVVKAAMFQRNFIEA